MTDNTTYKSPVELRKINNILILISFILLLTKVIIAYQFYHYTNDDKLFNIQLLMVLLYYSAITLSWSNDRLESVNIIVSKFIDKFIEYKSVLVADLLLVVVLFFARRQHSLTKHKHVMKLFCGFMIMRIIIHLWRISDKLKIANNVSNYDNHIESKLLTDSVLVKIKEFIISN
mgnify:CR=1 FL=1|tara:strand:- start:220 stop:741 length:522 start_codon:yes stop_codon:yes gene_type:complete